MTDYHLSLTFGGATAGHAVIAESELGWLWVWTRPDGSSAYGSGESADAAGLALSASVLDWYEAMQ